MTPATWDASESEYDDPSAPGRPLPALVSLHFLRSALRRRWVACVLCAVAGLLTAAALLVVLPASHDAKAMLVLAHDPQTDPTRAMSTDVSLLTSRTVAAHTIAKLGLRMTSDEFLSNLTVVPVSDDLVSLTLTAPSDREAVRRLGILTSTYLDFRAEQISLQSTIVVDGMQQRIVELQEQVADLSQRIEQLSAAGGSEASALSDAIAQRAQVNGQIETLVQSVQDATLRNSSIASSSRVIDPAAVETGGVKRRIVLFLAITSDKLRRRFDVAAALQVPVPVSVGRIAPVSSRWLWLPHLRAVNTRRAAERQRLARAIEMELALPGRFGRLAVACIDNPDEVCFALAAAAWDLAAREIPILLLDLSEHGSLEAAVRNLMPGDNVNRLSVLRPRGVPALARDPADLYVVGHEDEDSDQPSPADTDVSLILADLDPSVGADHLTVWTERVIVAVTAGRSSAERVRTAADLVRAAELDLRFAALLHADGTDESSGEAGLDRRGPMHLRKGQGSPDARSTNRTLEAR
jgi:hypothetical protein